MQCNMASVLIVAHAPLASALQAVAGHVYADCGHAVLALNVDPATPPEQVRDAARALMRDAAEPDWLVLTDVFGATPCNAAVMLADPQHVRVVTGVNVPMLWRTLCYAHESLESLVTRAVSGATHGVMALAPPRPPAAGSSQPIARDPGHRHHQQ